MKRYLTLTCAALLVLLAPRSSQAQAEVSIEFFYENLGPHGDWVSTNDYGYVWQPTLAQDPNWAPYADGYWAYTDSGWTWISNEPFGWATYHYGRWIRLNSAWVWVPGYEWAPAWVSWRQTDDAVGWAPLPPEARWSVGIGFNRWTDSYYDVGPSYYNFVPMPFFGRRSSLRSVIVDRSRNYTYIDQSVNVTNISYNKSVVNNIFVGGPDPVYIDRYSQEKVHRLKLRRDDDGFRRDWGDDGRRTSPGRDGNRSFSRIDQDELIVAAPSIRRDERPGRPSQFRDSQDRIDVDRGWAGMKDKREADRLREKLKQEMDGAPNDKLPPKTPDIVRGPGRSPEGERPDRPSRPGDRDRPGEPSFGPGKKPDRDRDGVVGKEPTDPKAPGRAGEPADKPGMTRPGLPPVKPDAPPLGDRPPEGRNPADRPGPGMGNRDLPPGTRTPGRERDDPKKPDAPAVEPGTRPGMGNRDLPPGNRPTGRERDDQKKPDMPAVKPGPPPNLPSRQDMKPPTSAPKPGERPEGKGSSSIPSPRPDRDKMEKSKPARPEVKPPASMPKPSIDPKDRPSRTPSPRPEARKPEREAPKAMPRPTPPNPERKPDMKRPAPTERKSAPAPEARKQPGPPKKEASKPSPKMERPSSPPKSAPSQKPKGKPSSSRDKGGKGDKDEDERKKR